MEDLAGIGRSLPIYALLPALAASFALMLFGFRRLGSGAGLFVGWAMYVRFVCGALHDFTFQRSPLGLSYNALTSVTIFAIGLLVVRRRTLFDAAVLPFLPLLLIIVISGLMNGETGGMSAALTKYAYLIILILATVDAFQDLGPDRLFARLLIPFALPFTMQLLSVVLNIAKPGETDGADSYIGGYNHEAAFSIVLLSAILIVCLMRNLRLPIRFGLIIYGFAAIVLANYRTAILSVLPLVGVTILASVPRRFVAAQRALVAGVMVIAAIAVFAGGAMHESDRFSDLGTAAQEGGDLIKRPETFSPTDRRVMSGRSYIWSMYYYGWADARMPQKLIGFGQESWGDYFHLYAHNTLVSSLFETGVFGVVATLFMWLSMMLIALLARAGPRLELIAAHLSFLILNMATMPMWQIEGMIFYGILCGYTVYWFVVTRQVAAGRVERPQIGNLRFGSTMRSGSPTAI